MEAMACKLPIISTIFPTGIRELLEGGAEPHSPCRTKYGWLVKQNDVAGFSESLELLHQNNRLHEEFSLNVQKRVSDFDSSCPLVPFSQLLPKSIYPPQKIGHRFLVKISVPLLFILMALAIFPPYPA